MNNKRSISCFNKTGNIVLVGFMATGKTIVARKLAKKLKKKYISVDTIIEKKVKMKIHKIFSLKGEKFFRQKETEVLKLLSNIKNSIISTGGGVVVKPQNRKLLKKIGFVVWLKASPKTIDNRLGNLKIRPLLNIPERSKRLKKIKEMLKARQSMYSDSAHISINTNSLAVNEVVNKIISML